VAVGALVLLDGGLMAEGARETRGKRTAGAAVATWPRREEGDGANAWAPSVGGSKRERRVWRWAAGEMGQERKLGRAV
jgi:hypothetical protein